jgi:SagB-type dehydrogenase family enzyme
MAQTIVGRRATDEPSWLRFAIELSPAVRIFPPSEVTGDAWLVEDILNLRRYRLSWLAIVVLLASMEPMSANELVDEVSRETSRDRPLVGKLVDALLKRGLVIRHDAQDAQMEALRRGLLDWRGMNWEEAGEYHFATHDYPFFDYLSDGWARDAERMRGYAAERPDTERAKSYPDSEVLPLPPPAAGLAATPLRDVLEQEFRRELSAESLFAIVSLALAEVEEIRVRRWPAAPMLRRTSPSGGARHPTEGYVLVIDVDGLESGWYHVRARPPALESVQAKRFTTQELCVLFPESYSRTPGSVQAILVLTCVFARNMYRYREPRTFRTVHQDVGHIATTVALVAQANGVSAYPCYIDNEAAIEAELHLDELVEGFMMSVGLAGPLDHGEST